MAKERTRSGWSTKTTRPDAKPRGRAPDYLARIEALRAAIARYGVTPDQRQDVRRALEGLLDELDKPIIV